MIKYWYKWNKLWNETKELIGKDLYNDLIYGGRYIKTKVRLFDGVIYTNFHDSEVPKETMHCVCLWVITIDSIMKIDKNITLK